MKKIITILIIAHFLPILGVFMEDVNGNDKWYKYIYVVVVYIASIYVFIRQYNKYLTASII